MTQTRFAFALLAGLLACRPSSGPVIGATLFTFGEEGDPVLEMALGSGTQDTVQITIKNGTTHAWSAGLVTIAPLFSLGAAGSNALVNFVNPGQVAPWGNATVLASASGLSLGSSATTTPALAAGASFTMTVSAPRGGSLYFVAATDDDDWGFVGIGPITYGSSGSSTAKLLGYMVPGLGKNVRTNSNVITSATTTATTSTTTNLTLDCSAGVMTSNAMLFKDDFSANANDLGWPGTAGYAGDFNGEWYTDGVAARVKNPTWPGADPNAPPLPVITGFVKFLDVCPAAGSKLSVAANVNTNTYTDEHSDATLVVYYFDGAGAVLSVDTSLPLHGGNDRRTALYESTIPANTRRIAIAPMVLLGPTETQTVYYQQLQVDYAAAAPSRTALYSDNFTSYGASAYGANQPSGWIDYGGDWYVNPPVKLLTLYNTAWGGGSAPPPFEAGIYKDVSLTGKYSPGNTITGRIFAASTYTSPSSFVLLRLLFSGGEVVDTERLMGSAWANLDLRRVPIPAGATSVRVQVVAYLGEAETSSLYVQALSLNIEP